MKEDFKEFIEKVRSAADIVDVIGGYVPLKKRGTKHWACCPFHGEKTPSFAVDSNKQLFYCFGCHLGGDVFKFIQQKENISFVEAAKRLAEHFNIPIPEREKTAADTEREKEFQKTVEINELTARYFSACLNHAKVGAAARDYLAKRGITQKIIDAFQIGYAQDKFESLVDALTSKNVNYAEMLKAGVVLEGRANKPYDKFRNRVIIPIKNPRGKIVGFGGRILGNGEPKYLNTAETIFFNKRYLLFAFDLAQKSMRDKGYAVIVEGYMDAISLHAAGINNVVASMGTAFSEQQAGILRRNVSEVIFCYDSDDPGRNASVRAVSIAKAVNLKVKVAIVPGAKDPDEFVRSQGVAAFEKVLNEAVDGLDFQITETIKKFDISSVNGKIDAIKEITKFLLECSNEIETDEQIRKIAQRLVIDEVLIKEEYRKAQRFRRRRSFSENISITEKDTTVSVIENKSEKFLVALLLQDIDLLPKCQKILETLEWQNQNLSKIYKLICSYVEKNQNLNDLSNELDDEQNSLLVSLKIETLPSGDKNKILFDCIKDLKISQLEKKYNLHAGIAAEYEKTGDTRVLDELKKCQEIRNEIKEFYKN